MLIFNDRNTTVFKLKSDNLTNVCLKYRWIAEISMVQITLFPTSNETIRLRRSNLIATMFRFLRKPSFCTLLLLIYVNTYIKLQKNYSLLAEENDNLTNICLSYLWFKSPSAPQAMKHQDWEEATQLQQCFAFFKSLHSTRALLLFIYVNTKI